MKAVTGVIAMAATAMGVAVIATDVTATTVRDVKKVAQVPTPMGAMALSRSVKTVTATAIVMLKEIAMEVAKVIVSRVRRVTNRGHAMPRLTASRVKARNPESRASPVNRESHVRTVVRAPSVVSANRARQPIRCRPGWLPRLMRRLRSPAPCHQRRLPELMRQRPLMPAVKAMVATAMVVVAGVGGVGVVVMGRKAVMRI